MSREAQVGGELESLRSKALLLTRFTTRPLSPRRRRGRRLRNLPRGVFVDTWRKERRVLPALPVREMQQCWTGREVRGKRGSRRFWCGAPSLSEQRGNAGHELRNSPRCVRARRPTPPWRRRASGSARPAESLTAIESAFVSRAWPDVGIEFHAAGLTYVAFVRRHPARPCAGGQLHRILGGADQLEHRSVGRRRAHPGFEQPGPRETGERVPFTRARVREILASLRLHAPLHGAAQTGLRGPVDKKAMRKQADAYIEGARKRRASLKASERWGLRPCRPGARGAGTGMSNWTKTTTQRDASQTKS